MIPVHQFNIKYIYIIAAIVLGIVTLFYLKMLYGFFQHDEWQTFTSAYLKNYESITDVARDSFLPKASHYAPFFSLTFNFLFSVLGLNYVGYATVSVVLHLTSVLLVFILVYRLTNKVIIAFTSALFFGLNASSHQATSWIIANINTHGATILGLLCLISFSYFAKKSKKQHFFFIVSLVLLIFSLLFKEITIAFFAFLPLALFWYTKKSTRSCPTIYYAIILGLGILYFVFRLLMLVMSVPDTEFIVTKDQSRREIAYNTLTFPSKMFAQSVVPTWQLLTLSKIAAKNLPDSIAGRPGTTEFDQFVENVALQIMDFLIFAVALISLLFIWRSRTDRKIKGIVFLSFIFIILNSFIYAISPGRSGSIPVIDSRNIYLPAIGTSIFIATIMYIIAKGKIAKILLIFAPLIFLHIYWLNSQLELRADVGSVRSSILHQIKREHPNIPEKVVFYVASDTPYYGMAEKIPPFETGLGQALLVWYHSTEQFPTGLFENRFLRFITDQGYREVEGRGFGYFRDINLLKEALKKNNLSTESIISYEFYGSKNILKETTALIR